MWWDLLDIRKLFKLFKRKERTLAEAIKIVVDAGYWVEAISNSQNGYSIYKEPYPDPAEEGCKIRYYRVWNNGMCVDKHKFEHAEPAVAKLLEHSTWNADY